jgi:hypothetical protein
MKFDPKYKFTEEWFDIAIPIWEELFKNHYKDPIKSVLEVGCYEGRATVWLSENVLGERVDYDVVDTFGGSITESGMVGTANRLEGDKSFIQTNFEHNISFFKDRISFNIHKGYSQHELPKLVEAGKQYDFIYIDASHQSDDTFVDGYFANKMLKKGGLIIFDDFGWKDPKKPHDNCSPEVGVRLFFSLYSNLYQGAFSGYQIGAIKVA